MDKNIPKAAGLNKCLCLRQMKCLDKIADTDASINIHSALSLESTYPIIKPEIIELSVIRNVLVLTKNMSDSIAMADITAIITAVRNITSLSLTAKKTAKQAKYRINWVFIDLRLIIDCTLR
jgi:hypothetical protein